MANHMATSTASTAQWALVTGASSGLGIEFSAALAARKINVVLAARREKPMQTLADRLRREQGVEVVVEVVDLTEPGSVLALQKRLDARGIEPDFLINNAAFGISSAFVEQAPDRLMSMLQLDVMALTELTHAFGGRMRARGHGHILLVASMAAHQPTPLMAAYGAAKAFVLSLGEALNVEMAPQVGVTVLSPGMMETGFFDVAGFVPKPSLRRTMLSPAKVAAIGLDAMFAGKPSVIAGRLNAVMAFSNRFFSRHLQSKMVLRISKA